MASVAPWCDRPSGADRGRLLLHPRASQSAREVRSFDCLGQGFLVTGPCTAGPGALPESPALCPGSYSTLPSVTSFARASLRRTWHRRCALASSLDRDLPVYNVRTMEEVASRAAGPPRPRAILLGCSWRRATGAPSVAWRLTVLD